MKILIVEDEPMVAERLVRLVQKTFKAPIINIEIKTTLAEAERALIANPPDLVFLDLNLDSEDGFDLLRQTLIGPYQTIIASANTDRAIEAFEFGVLDFIPKPFSIDRITLAWERFKGLKKREHDGIKTLPVKAGNRIKLLNLKDIVFFQAQGKYIDIFLNDGTGFALEKSLNSLEILLPSFFFRVHRSIIVNLSEVDVLASHRGSKYSLTCKNGLELPVGRSRIGAVRKVLEI